MVEDKTVNTITEPPRRRTFLFLLSVLSVIAVAVLAFYLGLQKTAITEEQKLLEAEVNTLNSEIRALQGQNVQATRFAQQWLDTIEADEIKWSSVITKIDSLIPYDAVTRSDKVRFLSYSGSQNGQISLNATTRSLVTEPYSDVAELVAVFNESSFFSNGYVPSITRGESDVGEKVASFIFNVTYNEENFSNFDAEAVVAEDVAAETTPAVTEEVGVSR